MMPVCHLHADYDWLNVSGSRTTFALFRHGQRQGAEPGAPAGRR